MGGYFFIYFFYDLLSLSVFKDHSPHFNVELVVNFSLHTLVHRLHKLLNHIFNVLHVLIVIKPFLKAFIDAHHLWISTERSVC